jgi:hypothetical protein
VLGAQPQQRLNEAASGGDNSGVMTPADQPARKVHNAALDPPNLKGRQQL